MRSGVSHTIQEVHLDVYTTMILYVEEEGTGQKMKMSRGDFTNLEKEGARPRQTGNRVNEAEGLANVAAFAECIRII